MLHENLLETILDLIKIFSYFLSVFFFLKSLVYIYMTW